MIFLVGMFEPVSACGKFTFMAGGRNEALSKKKISKINITSTIDIKLKLSSFFDLGVGTKFGAEKESILNRVQHAV